MKIYIFYTPEGFTEDENGNDTDNCQILDWQNGKMKKMLLKISKKKIQISVLKISIVKN